MVSHRLRALLVVACVATTTLMSGGAGTAVAEDEHVLVMSGTGSISPGLSARPQLEFYSLTGSAVDVVDGSSDSFDCILQTSTDIGGETLAAGEGALGGSCVQTIQRSMQIACAYVRIVNVMAVACVIRGPVQFRIITGTLLLTFDQQPPATVTSFSYAGTWVVSDT